MEKVNEQFKTDKRSIRTRKAIKFALCKMVKTHELSDISITDIAKMAGINRNSFYTHYKNIYNILDDINNDILVFTEGIIKKHTYAAFTEDPYPVMCEFSNAIANNKYFSEYLLFSRSATELTSKLKDSICELVYGIYCAERKKTNLTVRYMIAYLIGGIFEVYSLYFRREKEIPLEQITAHVSQLVYKGIINMRAIKNG